MKVAILLGSLLVIAFYLSTAYKENFLADYCAAYASCHTCANASGCSWCPTTNTCLSRTSLKSTDTTCNPTTVISSAFSCDKSSTIVTDADFTLYRDQVDDRVRPPNVYLTQNMEYSPETVMGQVSHLSRDLELYQKRLPDIVASAVQDNIRPMVSNNYDR